MTKLFKAFFSLYSKDQGGRRVPIFSGYEPLFYLSSPVKGVVTLTKEMLAPGQSAEVVVTLEREEDFKVGKKFTFLEGKHVAGEGEVLELLD